LKNSSRNASGYQPLESYGVIGNLHTIALVGMDGSIDWCCFPHFSSPPIFGALLDCQKGGRFQIVAAGDTRHKQFYLSDSNILLTRFLSAGGVGEIIDFMPIKKKTAEPAEDHDLYRMARAVRGDVEFTLECSPMFGFARTPPDIERRPGGVLFKSGGLHLELHSPVPLKLSEKGASARFTLKAGKTFTFILRRAGRGPGPSAPGDAHEAFEETRMFWRQWISKLQYQGRWREIVTRSALVLKMLTFSPSGAIVASPTTSLPEVIGGRRNWDYRYSWIRDASFTLYALLRLGFSDEAHAFMEWLQFRLQELGPDGSLQVAYGIDGEHDLTERSVRSWSGYRNSSPVRVGNAAHRQRQMDIYGELMDAIYLYNKYGAPISYDLWSNLRRLLGFVCRHWREKDQGIWEVRNQRQHFVYSKVMCWVALDRGLRLAQKRSLPADWALWSSNRDAIYEEVMKKGWDARHQSFTQHYGTQATDASTLLLPLVKFISPRDPRMISTLARIRETLVSDSLVYRYEIGKGLGDGLSGREGTFSACTFWYVEALARSGQVEQARWIFEKMLGYASPLGLYAEEIGPTGEQLGNFPQAFTHLGLISAAYNLDKALNKL